MKYIYSLFIILTVAFISFSFFQVNNNEKIVIGGETAKLYNIAINDIDGNPINLADFSGKKILFVNVASKCGYTPQYAELQKLHELYQEKVVIIGVPCNQFGAQEPGNGEEIKTFCQKNYGVEFLITEKTDVKGEAQHPLYKWLTSKTLNGKMDNSVKWNFNKFLVSETGELLNYFGSSVKPMSEKIVNQL